MAGIFNPQILKQESNYFTSETSLFDETNQLKYEIPCPEKEALKTQFHASKSTVLRVSNFHNQANTLELIMRKCFKKCNKFVLEDWVDYSELDCALKCSVLQKEALNILKNKGF
jgi:hypothetical protein